VGLHYFIALFEIVSGLQALRARLVCDRLLHGADSLDLGLRGVRVVVALLERHLRGNELLLSELVCVATVGVVLGVGEGGLGLPVGI